MNYSIFKSMMAVAIVAGLANFAGAEIVLWDLNDGSGTGGMPVTAVADPLASGNGTVHEVIMASGTSQWTNVNQGNTLDLTPYAGQDLTMSVDVLLADTATDDNIYFNLGGLQQGFVDLNTFSTTAWTTHTHTFTAYAGNTSPANALFLSNNKNTTADGTVVMYFDNVRLTAPSAVVPEPGSACALLGLALSGVMVRRRR